MKPKKVFGTTLKKKKKITVKKFNSVARKLEHKEGLFFYVKNKMDMIHIIPKYYVTINRAKIYETQYTLMHLTLNNKLNIRYNI